MNIEKQQEYWSKVFDTNNFSGKTWVENTFEACTFNRCDFRETVFSRCHFIDCEFISCNLSLVKIKYSQFSDVVFRESKLVGIDWTKVDWSNLMLCIPIKFYQSVVNDCSFYGLSLTEIVIEECKAHNVDFREGNFNRCNFTKTDFSNSLFDNTNLTEADFSEATNYHVDIYRNNIKRAKFSRLEAVCLLESLDIVLVD